MNTIYNLAELEPLQLKHHADYEKYIKKLFGYADEVCFVVDPNLDSIRRIIRNRVGKVV